MYYDKIHYISDYINEDFPEFANAIIKAANGQINQLNKEITQQEILNKLYYNKGDRKINYIEENYIINQSILSVCQRILDTQNQILAITSKFSLGGEKAGTFIYSRTEKELLEEIDNNIDNILLNNIEQEPQTEPPTEPQENDF